MLNDQCSMAAFSLKKPRSNDKLFHLPEPDQQTLLDWNDADLTLIQIAERAAKPRAEGGLDLQTSKSALSRYYERRQLIDALHAAADNLASISSAQNDLNPNPNHNNNTTTSTTTNNNNLSATPTPHSAIPHPQSHPLSALGLLVQSKALQLASRDELTDTQLKFILQYHTRLEAQQIRQRALDLHYKRLAFHMQQFQYKTFKRLMSELPELMEILHNSTLSPEEKVHAAFCKAFGREPVETVAEANQQYRQSFPQADHAATELQVDPAELTIHDSQQDHARQGINFIRQTYGLELDEREAAEAAIFREKMLQDQQRALARMKKPGNATHSVELATNPEIGTLP
jgi:hypothetical protein